MKVQLILTAKQALDLDRLVGASRTGDWPQQIEIECENFFVSIEVESFNYAETEAADRILGDYFGR